jgi:uncharacterized protein (UPF0332 family)
MSIETMVQEGRIHPFKATKEDIAKVMSIAKRDLSDAEQIKGTSLDWTYSIAYNAVLQACRAFIFHMGYRPASYEAHKATFEFMQLTVEERMKPTIDYFDRARKKRHRVTYETAGLVSEKETEQLLRKAREFLEYIESKLEEDLM